MIAPCRHADAREGIRELITELHQAKSKGVLVSVLSTKWITLIAADSEPPRVARIGPFNDFTVVYVTDHPADDPALHHHVEVVRTDEGLIYFRENGCLLAPDEFASKLIRLVVQS